MLTRSIVLSCLGLLAANGSAQCATLTVTGTGAPGTSLQFHLDGQASGAFAFVAAAFTQGTTTISFGSLGSLTLGLDSQFLALPGASGIEVVSAASTAPESSYVQSLRVIAARITSFCHSKGMLSARVQRSQ